ncbi:MAG: phosphoglucosamine mutase [Christensenellales bacterium]
MKYFGTDGIRYKEEYFTEEFLRKASFGISALDGCRKVVIGRDPRKSGKRMESTIAHTLAEAGVDVLIAGMVPTPTLAYLTRYYGCDYGIMLSASHNPPEYNGIKLFSAQGSKVSEEAELAVEKYIDEGFKPMRSGGTITEIDGENPYVDYLKKVLNLDLKGIKVALDTANGATSVIAPRLFAEAGAKVTAFNTEIDGERINEACGATVPTTLLKIMEGDYDIGFTYDGDGDRVMCVQGGKIYNGDHLMYVHCKKLKEEGRLVDNVMVGTIMSNSGTEKACRNAGITLVRTAVGDKCVFREMEKHGYNVGGEESGHMIFSDYMPTGDGILASLLTATVNKETPLSAADDIKEYPSASDCVVCGKDAVAKFREDVSIKEFIDNIDKAYRTVIRPSGTEPKIRILVEAEDLEAARKKCAEIKKFIEEKIL